MNWTIIALLSIVWVTAAATLAGWLQSKKHHGILRLRVVRVTMVLLAPAIWILAVIGCVLFLAVLVVEAMGEEVWRFVKGTRTTS